MPAAYYGRECDSEDLFKGFKIEENETFKEHLNQYEVIFLNMQQFLSEAVSGNVTDDLEQEVLKDLEKEYGETLSGQNLGLAAALRTIYSDIVQMPGGGRIKINTRSFQNDMHTFKTKDDVLTLLIHLGYLAYDSKEKEAFFLTVSLHRF